MVTAGRENTYIISIDQSTQATKAILFDHFGKPVNRITRSHRQIYPGPNCVEHDPIELVDNVQTVIAELAAASGIEKKSLAGLAITNQRETVLAWDSSTGKPVYNALVWQDSRASVLCEELAASGLGSIVKAKTGLRLDPYFSASKLAWIVRESSVAKAALASGHLMAGTIDSWLVWNLTKGSVFATDYSNASRTMLFDIKKLCWDQELIRAFGLEGVRFPDVRCSDADFGIAQLECYDASLPIIAVMGDSHAALFGHCGWKVGDAKATYGTGSSIMSNIGPQPEDPGEGLVLSLAWGRQGHAEYVFEGNIHSTGYTIRWLRDSLGLFSDYAEAERMSVEIGGNGGVFLVPAFAGLGAPYWAHGISALVTGLSHGSDRRHIVRAGLESIAFQIRDLVAEMDKHSSKNLFQLHVDGGPTRNAFLMQFQADILGIPVIVPAIEELSALGTAYMGGIARGFWSGIEDVKALPVETKRFEPMMSEPERNTLISGWESAVYQALNRKQEH